VVLATLGSTEGSKDWVQAKLEQRIRADLLSTVQACLSSIRAQKTSYRRIKTRYMRTRQQLHDSSQRASQMLYGPHHRRKTSSFNSMGSLRSLEGPRSLDGGSMASPASQGLSSPATPMTPHVILFTSNDSMAPDMALSTIQEANKRHPVPPLPLPSPSPVRAGKSVTAVTLDVSLSQSGVGAS
jgi:hypothetical protein